MSNEPKIEFTAKPSDLVSLFEYYGKAQGMIVGQKVYEISVEDHIPSGQKDVSNGTYRGPVRTYPRTWLDKLDFIDKVHEGGAKSDKEIVAKLQEEHKSQKASKK